MLANRDERPTASPECSAATLPVSTTMPAPTVAPTPMQVSANTPRLRGRAVTSPSTPASEHSSSTGLRAQMFKSSSTADQPQQFRGLLLHQRRAAAGFDVQAHQRLGVGTAQIEAPFGKLHRQTVGEIHTQRPTRIDLLSAGDDLARLPLQVRVDFAAGRKQPHAITHQL